MSVEHAYGRGSWKVGATGRVNLDATRLVGRSPRKSDKTARVEMGVVSMCICKGFAVDFGTERHGAYNVNNFKVLNRNVHVGLICKLPLRTSECQASGYGSVCTSAHDSTGVCAHTRTRSVRATWARRRAPCTHEILIFCILASRRRAAPQQTCSVHRRPRCSAMQCVAGRAVNACSDYAMGSPLRA